MTKEQQVLETLRKHPRSTARQLASLSGVKLGTVTGAMWHLIKQKKAYVVDHGGHFKSARYTASYPKKTVAKKPVKITHDETRIVPALDTLIVHTDGSETTVRMGDGNKVIIHTSDFCEIAISPQNLKTVTDFVLSRVQTGRRSR